ncbi:MAG: VWA domain-containing protein [Hyphomicrobiaceae bacterium]
MPDRKQKGHTTDVDVPGGPSSVTKGRSSSAEVDVFLEKIKVLVPAAVGTAGCGRLIFAMDATMSRQPTWDLALGLQGQMFDVVRDIGGLDVQLVYFRGLSECRASRWESDPAALARLMTSVACRGGPTQIRKVLVHARSECEKQRVSALVYVGDCMEENVDDLCARAGDLALLGVPVFLFQEGRDEAAGRAFREIARLTRGAWCLFDAGAADQLRELLRAVAVYAAGGFKALERLAEQGRNRAAQHLLTDMRRK